MPNINSVKLEPIIQNCVGSFVYPPNVIFFLSTINKVKHPVDYEHSDIDPTEHGSSDSHIKSHMHSHQSIFLFSFDLLYSSSYGHGINLTTMSTCIS